MKKLATLVGAMAMAVTLAGCPIWLESNETGWECGWQCATTCVSDWDCAPGYRCNGGFCDASWFCDWDGTCPPGYVCDDRDTCIPVEPVVCSEDADCPDGYCDAEAGATGLCVTTGSCEDDADCARFGPGLACDDRGVCVRDGGPCPDGLCGCVEDDECDLGRLCINARCTDPAFVCFFDFECAGDSVCLDNACHAACSEAGCPIGQACEGGICMTPATGFDACVFDEDCGEPGLLACLNGTCHPTCTDREGCSEGETCSGGICRADTRPVRDCAPPYGSPCDGGMDCIRGACRMPCVAPINCADQGVMTECFDGFCRAPVELDPACIRAADCAEGASCLNGSCVTLAR